ncbi:hypothetical protein [Chamaesiphon sp. GL140_3_metabinner_50]|uniref:hypothetical protein n=1 Tax=Chamaesiphon sp. GL140_3_metabinner_50 TaxID=2970812 RepID=UPI0025F61FC0|nr:hypothetical protein [Chamaesiphon sp. GL140_3_metabinner_50]
MVRVTFGGPVKVLWQSFNGSEEITIDDREILQKFDDCVYSHGEGENKSPVELSQYLQDGRDTEHLYLLGIRGGILRYEYRQSEHRLWILTEYKSPRKLSEEEFQSLYLFTRSQWYDGAGENFAGELADRNEGIAPLGHPESVYLFEDD